MKSNLKKTIFNPEDKLSETKEAEVTKYYLQLMPYNKADIARKNKFRFDTTNKKWYTTDENHVLLNDFKKKVIDFAQFRKENNLYFDGDTKEWYTYSSNELFKLF